MWLGISNQGGVIRWSFLVGKHIQAVGKKWMKLFLVLGISVSKIVLDGLIWYCAFLSAYDTGGHVKICIQPNSHACHEVHTITHARGYRRMMQVRIRVTTCVNANMEQLTLNRYSIKLPLTHCIQFSESSLEIVLTTVWYHRSMIKLNAQLEVFFVCNLWIHTAYAMFWCT